MKRGLSYHLEDIKCKCEICDKPFNTQRGLTLHWKWNHEVSKFKKHDCSLCAFTTTSSKRLTEHYLKYHPQNVEKRKFGEHEHSFSKREEESISEVKEEEDKVKNNEVTQSENIPKCDILCENSPEEFKKKLIRGSSGAWGLDNNETHNIST